ncbi:MAG: IMP dehydrogenase [Parcubacteria group bacterium]|jgi:IMP dehydrogenase
MERLKRDAFFKKMSVLGLALSYGDVRLRTGYSKVAPVDVELRTKFSRNITLNCPIVSSPMDTVTEWEMAIEMAKRGGLGILHRALLPIEQARQVARVKYYLNGLIKKPIQFRETDTMESIVRTIEEKGYQFQTFPVINAFGKIAGLLTSNDFEFCSNMLATASEVMSKDLLSIPDYLPLEKVFEIMRKNKKKVLPVVDPDGQLKGMYVFSDIKRAVTGSSANFNLDANGNLLVGAAVGVGEEDFERAELCVQKGVDVIVIDTAHGDSEPVYRMLKTLKKQFPDLDVVVGNVSEGKSAKRLVKAGADGVKVGQGPGSICTTRVIAGIGHPQVSAVHECEAAIRGSDVPICADGGMKYSGDITIAIGAGASSVMLGNLLAGTKESPGDVIIRDGMPMKSYRGMGSLSAMEQSESSRERYRQPECSRGKLVPEGVEGEVPFKGEVAEILYQLLGGLRAGMGYVGAANIKELQGKADFIRISGEGLKESHPHGVYMTKDPPNYRRG